jgi:phage repressor protein C with HTH and peptisase S24 domain
MLNKRITTAMSLRNLTQSQLARLLTVKPQTIQSICAGKTKQPRNLDKIAVALDVSLEWLVTGNGQMQSNLISTTDNIGLQIADNEQISNNIASSINSTENSLYTPNKEQDFSKLSNITLETQQHTSPHKAHQQDSITILPCQAIEDAAEINYCLYFSLHWLQAQALKPDALLFSISHTHAMSPLIPYGSQFLIDTSDTDISDGCIYLFNINKRSFVRRLAYDISRNIVISCENQCYIPEKVSPAMVDIIGKIVWVSSSL